MSTDINKYITTAETDKNPSVFDYLRLRGEFAYPTDSVEVYAKSLTAMNLGDLHTHAMDKGIKPSHDRRRLEQALLNQFKQVTARRKAAKTNSKFTAEQLKEIEQKRQRSIERNTALRTLS